MSKKQFIEDVFELAFGDDAINREFTFDEVLVKLREFSDAALVSEKPAGYTGVTDDENKGVELTQAEVDTLLTNKTQRYTYSIMTRLKTVVETRCSTVVKN